jgi:mutator protein MutT
MAAANLHPHPQIEVAAGLVFREGKLLITQRRPEARLGGLWEFPGGKRQAGETFEACLARELREELGIEVAVGELVESLTHAYPEETVSLRFYRCRWLDHEPRPLGCADFKWVTPETLAEHAFPAADARLLEKLGRRFHCWAAKACRSTPGRSAGNCSRRR